MQRRFADLPAVTIRGNLVTDVLGVTDGDSSSFSELFGFGLYIDNNSRDFAAESNVVVDASVTGILYQNSSGSITGNLVVSHQGRSAVSLSGTTKLNSFTGNELLALAPSMVALAGEDSSMLGDSDGNVFFTPYSDSPVALPDAMSLSAWQNASGKDQNSTGAWYSLSESDPPNVEVFLNPTAEASTVTLDGSYLELDQSPVSGSLELPAYGGVALVIQ